MHNSSSFFKSESRVKAQAAFGLTAFLQLILAADALRHKEYRKAILFGVTGIIVASNLFMTKPLTDESTQLKIGY